MSKIKFVKVSSGYDSHIKTFYEKNGLPGSEWSYEKCLEKFLDDCFGWAGFWKLNLEKSGKFDAVEIVFNNEVLQKKWAYEQGEQYDEHNWQQEILLKQLQANKPEVLFISDIYHYAPWYDNIKTLIPTLKLVIGWDGILYHDVNSFRACDLILTCVRETVDFYEANGIKSKFFPFGFEQTILEKLVPREKKYNVTFIGSVVLIKGYHYGRLNTLYELAALLPVDYWISNLNSGWELSSKQQISRFMHTKFDEMRKVYRLGKINKGALFGLEMYQAYSDSRFVLNTHGDNSPLLAANFRMTEATGAGSCMVTDWKENISEYFEPDKEVVTYRSAAEAVDKIKYLMTNENKRKEIASAGQQRVLKNYTFKKRIDDFLPYLYSLL